MVAAAPLILASGCGRVSPRAADDDEPTDDRPELVRRYDILRNRNPIESEPVRETLSDGWRRARFTFRGQNRRVLTAELVTPPATAGDGPGAMAVAVYLLRAVETPDVALEVARGLQPLRVAVLSFSPESSAGSASANEKRETLERDRLAALDARFALDALAAFPEIDRGRIVVIGASQGAAPACIVGGVDPHVNGVVSIVGGGDIAATMRERFAADPGERAAEIKSALKRIDPRAYLPFLGPRPILFVQAERDTTPRPHVESLIAAATSNKHVVWLDEEHRFPFDRAAPAVREWLRTQLGW